MNSSPPMRATVSLSRRLPWRRWLSATSRRSPMAWPRLSLIALKRSTSRKATATSSPVRATRRRRHVQPVVEQPPVRQSRQLVVGGLAQHAVAVGLLDGHVANRRDPRAALLAQQAGRHLDREPLPAAADTHHLGPRASFEHPLGPFGRFEQALDRLPEQRSVLVAEDGKRLDWRSGPAPRRRARGCPPRPNSMIARSRCSLSRSASSRTLVSVMSV